MIYALLQLKAMHFDGGVWEIISALMVIVTVLSMIVFSLQVYKLQAVPKKGQFLTITEPRNIFMHYKKDQKYFVIIKYSRKILFSFILVFIQEYPLA